MLVFNNHKEYGSVKDPTIKKLLNCIDSIAGVNIMSHTNCIESENIRIYMRISDHSGLFFLTRCIDHRYWEYGYLWDLKLSVGDTYDGEYLPVSFELTNGRPMGKHSIIEALSLIENMEHHLNHENFIKAYELDLTKFNVAEVLEESDFE